MAKKTKPVGAKVASAKAALAKELRSLIPKLDADGLAFLVEQARIHLYNMQVVELNKAAMAAKTASLRKSAITQKTAPSRNDNLRINSTESGSSYYLYYRNKSVMFSREEMIHLIKMINVRESDLEIRERLYNWLERERKDIFAVLPIKDKFDELLKVLIKTMKKSFKIRS